MKDIYYMNASGKKLDLLSDIFDLQTGTLFDHDNEYTVNGLEVVGISGMLMEKELLLTIQSGNDMTFEEAMEQFNQITEPDLINKTPGKLYYGDSYQLCFLKGAELLEWEYDAGYTDKKIKMLVTHSAWIQEETFQFLPPVSETQEQSETIKAYDYTYDACVYPTERDPSYLINDHYDSCDFKMLVYGPRSQTNITIGENIYHVNYAIQEGEYMVIDSRETAKPGERVYLVRKNGEKLNLFDYRNPKYSIFAKIPTGTSAVRCGDAGMDITIYKRRSEPKWI